MTAIADRDYPLASEQHKALRQAVLSTDLLYVAGGADNNIDYVAHASTVYDPRDFGADGSGALDSKSAIQAAIDAAGADGVVALCPGTYAISGPLLVENDRVTIIIQYGAKIIAIDSGSFGTVEIDDSKDGMPQMKCMIAFRDCNGSRICGGGTIDAANLLFDDDAGEAGVFIRSCTRVVIENINVKNVWPDGYSAGGENQKRYSGILFVKCTSCEARFNSVNHIKYDGISARMQNTDILIYGNKCWDCYEGIQSSPQYATVSPEENNFRTRIEYNEVFDCWAQLIVFHSDYVTIRGNTCHSPKANTQGIRAIGANEGADIRGNIIIGVDDTSDNIAAHGFDAIRAGVTNPSFFEGNRIMFSNNAILLDANVVFYPTINNNIIWQCNTGIDLIESATTRARRAMIAGNFLRVYRYGIRAQDTGPTIISDNTIQEQSGWSGDSVGLDLDPNDNADVAYNISNSLPTGFSTNISLPAPPNPPSSSYQVYLSPDMINAADRYHNRGVLQISAGNTTGTDAFMQSIPGGYTPGGGEVQVTQISGTPTPFTATWTASILTVTIPEALGGDVEFGWTINLTGYIQP